MTGVSEPSARRSRRSILGGVLLAGVWMALILGAAAFLGLLSEPFSWFWAALALSPGLLGAAFLVRGRSPAGLGVAVAAALARGLLGWFSAPPGHAGIEARADDVRWPASWREVDREEQGNTWCFKGCPEIEYAFDVPGTYDPEDVAALTAALVAAGWRPNPINDGRFDFSRGRWRAFVLPSPGSADRGRDVSVAFTGPS